MLVMNAKSGSRAQSFHVLKGPSPLASALDHRMLLNTGAFLPEATSPVAAAIAHLRPWYLSGPALTPALQVCHFIVVCMTSGLTLVWCTAHNCRALPTFMLSQRA